MEGWTHLSRLGARTDVARFPHEPLSHSRLEVPVGLEIVMIFMSLCFELGKVVILASLPLLGCHALFHIVP
jgi:hypothetical protein